MKKRTSLFWKACALSTAGGSCTSGPAGEGLAGLVLPNPMIEANPMIRNVAL